MPALLGPLCHDSSSPHISKEDLDSQLDSYMAQTKGGLDRELDSYMKSSEVQENGGEADQKEWL